MALLAPLLFLLAPAFAAAVPQGAPAPAQEAVQVRAAPPAELHDVVRVVDGDTLHVRMGDTVEKLRLLSVDTEERLRGSANATASKPETLFGEECALWAQRFFADLAGEDGTTRVGLRFPAVWGDTPRRDVYGRLLCHVVLPDGTDFNVLLVELGKSPYFNKYGNSRICHADFVAAQTRARAAKRGIWDPSTNASATPEAPAARRPYAELLAWWQVRADAIDAFCARQAAAPERHADAEDPASLTRGFAACAADPEVEVEVFGTIERFFDEDDGSVTALFRSGDKRASFRAILPAGSVDAELRARLEASRDEFRQNYWSVRGRLAEGERGGWTISAGAPAQWTPAGAEPAPAGR